MLISTNYFGSIPYFQEIARFDEITIDLHELYKKQTWRNRTRILGSNGPLYLSVPVIKPDGSASTVGEVRITDETDWRKDHWKAIESSYTHAPFYFYYGPQIKKLIYHEEELLVDFNTIILNQILEWLDLQIEIRYSEKYIAPESKQDLRITLDKKVFDLSQKTYIQVFSDKLPFHPNLSIIDLLMNEGPLARNFIVSGERNLFSNKPL